MNPILIKNYDATAAVNPYRFVKPGANDYEVIQAAAATDLIIGATMELGVSANDITKGKTRLDVMHIGIAEIELGGNVTRGQKLTSDANGKGVAAAPGAGTNNSIGGTALVSGVSGDIIPVLLTIGSLQG